MDVTHYAAAAAAAEGAAATAILLASNQVKGSAYEASAGTYHPFGVSEMCIN